MAGFSESQRRWLSEVIQADQKALTKELERQHLALLEKLGLLDQLAGPNGQQKVQLQLPGSPDNMTAEKERPEPPQTRKNLIATVTSGKHEFVVAAEKPKARKSLKEAGIELMAAAGETYDDSKSWWHPVNCSRSNNFDAFFCFLIIINTVFMAFESQLLGLEAGREIGYRHYAQAGQDTWPGAEEAFAVLEWFFGILYTLELVIKVLGMKAQFFVDIACVFDFLIVGFWFVDMVLGNLMPLDGIIVKLARLARLLRLLRLVRKMSGFDALYVMTTAMSSSLQVLFWAFILLLLIQTANALLLNQIIMDGWMDTSTPDEDRQELFEYFGTFSRSMLSLFEITLGNWPVVARILQDKVGEWCILYSIGHKITVGFALVGILNGVFMQETFKVASSDDQIMLRQKRSERNLHRQKMEKLFKTADADHNGLIDVSEFKMALSNEEVRTWLAAQQLSVRDADKLFTLLDDGDRNLEADELVRGVERLKGPAKALDVAMLSNQHQALMMNMQRLMSALNIAEVTEEEMLQL